MEEGRKEAILAYAAEGATDKQIAHQLGLSVDTVDSYWRRIRNELDAVSRTHAVALWAKSGAERRVTELREKAVGALQEAAARTGDAQLLEEVDAFRSEPAEVGQAGALKESSWPVLPGRTFGRREELATLRRLLSPDRGGKRLVTLWGPGGTGKTRLAISAAHSLRKRYRQNAWYVTLATVTDPSVVPEYVLEAMNIKKEIGQPAGEQLAGFFLERAESCLLVLDNLEQLAGPDLRRYCSFLLSEVPDLRILATSRRPLGLPVEAVVPTLPLSVPEDLWDEDVAKASPSVQLFMDRASSNDLPIATVVELCQHLEGIPLAIVIAAAGSRKFPVAELLERMKSDAIGLRAKPADGTPRHRSLEQTIDWSYRLLREEHRVALAALSVFRGGWTADAAVGMFGDERMREALAELVGHSLIRRAEDSERYSMHEVIRQFAAAKLMPEETDHWRHRHASYFADYANELAQHAESSEEFRRDIGNFRAAIQWSLQGSSPDLAQRLNLNVAELLEGIELYEEVWRTLASVLGMAIFSNEQRVDLLRSAVLHSIRVGKKREGLAYAEECDRLARQTGQIDQRIFTLWARTGLLSGHQEGYEALHQVHLLMQEHPGASSPWGEIEQYVYQSLGLVCLKLGRFDEANEWLEAYRGLPTEERAYEFESDFLGDLATLRGEYSVARAHFMAAHEKARHCGKENPVAFYERKLGFAYLCEGKYEEAAEHLEKGIQIAVSLELPNSGLSQSLLLEIYIRMGRMREARRMAEELTGLSSCEVHKALALLAVSLGNKAEALHHSRRALGKALKLGDVSLIAQCYERRAQVQDRFGSAAPMRRSRGLAQGLRAKYALATWL